MLGEVFMRRADAAYRPDIDGLRGLAVLAVVLFHVGVTRFSGGFVGVDVFFVISGFLITRNILGELQAGSFTFARFYARRVRRLFPALFFTLFATFVGATCLFTPEHLRLMAESTLYALASLANIFFWQDSDYFSVAATFKPLLHVWSLAVEEQFYLVWPCALFALWRWRRLALLWPLALLVGASSLALSEHWLAQRQDAAAFYLTPARAFELAIGALCVKLVERQPRARWLLEPVLALGLAAMIVPAITYEQRTEFPGRHALLPCIGAGLSIYAGRAKYLGRLLDNRLAVGIGLISYSLYLVHWPLLVFYRYYTLHALDARERAALIGASLVAATMLYRFVEQPFRAAPGDTDRLSPAAFGMRSAWCAAGLAVLALSAWQNIGWSLRYPPEIASLLDQRSQWEKRRTIIRSEVCHFWSREQTFEQYLAASKECLRTQPDRLNVLVTGDSHAADLWAVLHMAYPQVNFLQATANGCRPGVDLSGKHDVHCDQMLTHVHRTFSKPGSLDGVIVSGRWRSFELDGLLPELRRYERLRIPLLLVGPSPEFELELPVLVSRYGRLSGLQAFVEQFQNRRREALNTRMQAIAATEHVSFLDRIDLVCGAGACPVFDERKRLLFVDREHWSVAGDHYIAHLLALKFPSVHDMFGAELAAGALTRAAPRDRGR